MTSPTLKSELRRGVNAFNLTVGFLTSITLGALAYFTVPPLHSLTHSGLLALLVMFLTTGLHTAGHAYFGWRFEKGIRAFQEGRFQEAVMLLGVVERKEMDHFDPDGVALRALQESRAMLA